MTKLTLQEQMLKAGLVTSKKMAKVQRTAKKSRVQAREAREAVEENKKAQVERDKQLSEQQKQAALSKEYKAQIKQLIEMNKITISRGDIGYNFTDNNLIKKIYVDKKKMALPDEKYSGWERLSNKKLFDFIIGKLYSPSNVSNKIFSMLTAPS